MKKIFLTVILLLCFFPLFSIDLKEFTIGEDYETVNKFLGNINVYSDSIEEDNNCYRYGYSTLSKDIYMNDLKLAKFWLYVYNGKVFAVHYILYSEYASEKLYKSYICDYITTHDVKMHKVIPDSFATYSILSEYESDEDSELYYDIYITNNDNNEMLLQIMTGYY